MMHAVVPMSTSVHAQDSWKAQTTYQLLYDLKRPELLVHTYCVNEDAFITCRCQ